MKHDGTVVQLRTRRHALAPMLAPVIAEHDLDVVVVLRRVQGQRALLRDAFIGMFDEFLPPAIKQLGLQ